MSVLKPGVRLACALLLAASAWAAPPVVNVVDPLTFQLTQGAFTTQIQAVERAESATSFYDYFSDSSHTGCMVRRATAAGSSASRDSVRRRATTSSA